jgi:hypothetical protein
MKSRIVEYYEHLLGKWGERTVLSLMNTVEPAYVVRRSRLARQTTTTIEVNQLEHRDAVKNSFAIRVIDSLFLEVTFASLTSNLPGKH